MDERFLQPSFFSDGLIETPLDQSYITIEQNPLFLSLFSDILLYIPKSSLINWEMGSHRQGLPTSASAALALWCLLLLAAVPWTAVGNKEGDALNALRQGLSDPTNVMESWDPSQPSPCTFFHVTCNADNQVIRVDLGNADLSGTLVPEISDLPYLQYLELFENNITGEIPSSIGNLSSLVSLDLYGNGFSGAIPSTLGYLSQLDILRLSNNSLSGSIPLSLTGLNDLLLLDLSYNDLSGEIPVTGVFSYFTPASFEGNPKLHYPDSSAPAPAPYAAAPSSGA